MKKRTITGILLAVILLPIVYFGGLVFEILCGLATLCAAYELRKMFYARKLKNWKFADFLNVFLSVVTYFVILYQSLTNKYILTLFLLLGLFLVAGLLLVFDKEFKGDDFGRYLITIFYSSVGFSSIAILRNKGLMVILALILIATMTDIFAYIIGVSFGKHKLCPEISPKKSVEGAIGGLFFGGITGGLVMFLTSFKDEIGFHLNPLIWILVAFTLSILGQIGDLVASKLKRTYDIKDFSNIFPGHGGILDRFDSLIFIACSLYFIVIWVEML